MSQIGHRYCRLSEQKWQVVLKTRSPAIAKVGPTKLIISESQRSTSGRGKSAICRVITVPHTLCDAAISNATTNSVTIQRRWVISCRQQICI